MFVMERPLTVLSLFDGMSCGLTALKRAGVPVMAYYASEVDPYAIKIAKKNHPEIIHLGDVNDWKSWDIPAPDLIIGGSPCQGFSFAGKQLAFDDPRSALFFTMCNIIEHYQPRFKLLENVRMKKDHLDVITQYMGCGEPHFINSTLVSAQNRQRYYWYNWEAPDPSDKGLILADIIEDGQVDRDKSHAIISSIGRTTEREYFKKNQGQMVEVDREKSYCIDANYHKGASYEQYKTKKRRQLVKEGIKWRKLTPLECERLQTLPDGYTEGVSNTQRYRMLGNGWTVDVVTHLFTMLKFHRW